MRSSALAAAGAQLAAVALARRDAAPSARRRIEAAPVKRTRVGPRGSTRERLLKGDVLRVGGVHRSVSPVRLLFDQGKLDPDPRINRVLFRAAEELHIHYMARASDLKAQDIGRTLAGDLDVGSLMGGERRAQHDAKVRDACRVMGWYEATPHHGNGRIVVAVVCAEMTLGQAANQYLPPARTALAGAVVLDRLRQGLFTLAAHWGLL